MRINEENRNRNGHVLIWDQPGLNSDDKKSKSKILFVLWRLLTPIFEYKYEEN